MSPRRNEGSALDFDYESDFYGTKTRTPSVARKPANVLLSGAGLLPNTNGAAEEPLVFNDICTQTKVNNVEVQERACAGGLEKSSGCASKPGRMFSGRYCTCDFIVLEKSIDLPTPIALEISHS